MKKRFDKFDCALSELVDIANMFDAESEDGSESRYKIFMATQLLFIEDSLRTIRLLLSVLIGLIAGELLAGLF